MDGKISLFDAAAAGVQRVRLAHWANKLDHIKIDILDGGQLGPWLHLYAPFNQECNGRDPVDFLWALPSSNCDIRNPGWEIYTGPEWQHESGTR